VTVTVQYWPKDKPIPEGWVLANDMAGTHHGVYSVLIRKEKHLNLSDK